MGNSLLAVRDINHKYIVVEGWKEIKVEEKYFITGIFAKRRFYCKK